MTFAALARTALQDEVAAYDPSRLYATLAFMFVVVVGAVAFVRDPLSAPADLRHRAHVRHLPARHRHDRLHGRVSRAATAGGRDRMGVVVRAPSPGSSCG